jgi:hypothetical protein
MVDVRLFSCFMILCLLALAGKDGDHEEAVEPDEAKVQVVASMVYKLTAVNTAVLTTSNGALCGRSAE